MTPASVLFLLLGNQAVRQRAALPVALVAGLCLAAALLAPAGSLALPKLLVEETSFLTLDSTSRAVLLLCGSLWLSCALAWPGDQEEDRLAGPMLLLCGVVVTVVPVFITYFVGRVLLRLNPAILLGALTGAMTSGASLSVVTAEAKSSIPAIGYAGTYAFGNVLLMVVGPLVVILG